MVDTIAQIGIILTGVSAIILVARKNKWGFVVGLISQPFWFTTAIVNEQWGVFLVSLAYLGSWIYGIYEWFFKKEAQREQAKP